MITIKNGNLFDVTCGIICHQVNCQGTMGAGVAKQFREKFPTSYKWYIKECESVNDKFDLLGRTLNCYENDEAIITVCMFAQYGYGRDSNFTYTDYDAFERCCKQIVYDVNAYGLEDSTINMPYKIGCGLANGDWHIIYSILEEVFENYNLILWKI